MCVLHLIFFFKHIVGLAVVSYASIAGSLRSPSS